MSHRDIPGFLRAMADGLVDGDFTVFAVTSDTDPDGSIDFGITLRPRSAVNIRHVLEISAPIDEAVQRYVSEKMEELTRRLIRNGIKLR